MEPHLIRCGRTWTNAYPVEPIIDLQWSRISLDAEGVALLAVGAWFVVLQWSRISLDAEGAGEPGTFTWVRQALQWSRISLDAEGLNGRRSISRAWGSFNGAASH